jgi:hypothetical protein
MGFGARVEAPALLDLSNHEATARAVQQRAWMFAAATASCTAD